MQVGVTKHSQINDTVNPSNRGYTQLVIQAKQVGSSGEGYNCGPVDTVLHEDRNALPTNTIHFPLQQETVMRELYFTKNFDVIGKEKAISTPDCTTQFTNEDAEKESAQNCCLWHTRKHFTWCRTHSTATDMRYSVCNSETNLCKQLINEAAVHM